MKQIYFLATVFLYALFFPGLSTAQDPAFKDVVYATVDGKQLILDVYMPKGIASPALVVWVHGGAWQHGTKAQVPKIFVEKGYAVASLDFRQATEARFPAGVHDIKAGIRFLRAKAKEYGYRTDRIAIAGESSGGHLAALVGVSNGSKELEGTVGNYLNQSSDVQAIIDYYGASDLMTILKQSTPHGLSVRKPALDLLLGGQPEDIKALAEQASPVNYVDRNDPPLLLLHGDQDNQMPINQSHELTGKYEDAGADVSFCVVYGIGHGGKAFLEGEPLKRALSFLERTIGH
jgi:acetyl esterase/lipase